MRGLSLVHETSASSSYSVSHHRSHRQNRARRRRCTRVDQNLSVRLPRTAGSSDGALEATQQEVAPATATLVRPDGTFSTKHRHWMPGGKHTLFQGSHAHISNASPKVSPEMRVQFQVISSWQCSQILHFKNRTWRILRFVRSSISWKSKPLSDWQIIFTNSTKSGRLYSAQLMWISALSSRTHASMSSASIANAGNDLLAGD